jgi:hypothetical protein
VCDLHAPSFALDGGASARPGLAVQPLILAYPCRCTRARARPRTLILARIPTPALARPPLPGASALRGLGYYADDERVEGQPLSGPRHHLWIRVLRVIARGSDVLTD